MKKVVLLNNKSSSVLNFRKQLIHFLIKKGYSVFAMAPDFSESDIEKIKSWGAVAITYKISRSGLNPLADFNTINSLEKIFKTIKPDVVFSFFVKPVIYGTIAARNAKVSKVLGMIEGLGFPFTEQPNGLPFKTKLIKLIQVMLYKYALPKADKVIFLNNDDPIDLIHKYKIKTKKIEILKGIGVDLNDFAYSEVCLDKISFLWVGRLLKEKGIWEFFKASEIVKRKYPNVEFKIVGGFDTENPGGISKKELDFFIQKGIVDYLGQRSDIADVIASCSCSCSSSYREGSSRIIQESMSVGRAIIATDIPGSREMVINGKNGFLVPKWNPEALAERMCFLIENPDLLIKMGKHSRELAEKWYDCEKINSRLLEIIEN